MLTWDESKRKLNIKNHGLDFVERDAIWDHFTVTSGKTTAKSAWSVSVFWSQMLL